MATEKEEATDTIANTEKGFSAVKAAEKES